MFLWRDHPSFSFVPKIYVCLLYALISLLRLGSLSLRLGKKKVAGSSVGRGITINKKGANEPRGGGEDGDSEQTTRRPMVPPILQVGKVGIGVLYCTVLYCTALYWYEGRGGGLEGGTCFCPRLYGWGETQSRNTWGLGLYESVLYESVRWTLGCPVLCFSVALFDILEEPARRFETSDQPIEQATEQSTKTISLPRVINCLNPESHLRLHSALHLVVVSPPPPPKRLLLFKKKTILPAGGDAQISEHLFSLDFCWPLSPLQAFVIATTIFDG